MKYLVLFAVLLVAYLVWRKNHPRAPSQSRPPKTGAQEPQPMVRCAQCTVHLPRADALTGTGGRYYCSHAHRITAEP